MDFKEYAFNIARRLLAFVMSFVGKGMSKYPAYKGVTYVKDSKGEYALIDVAAYWREYGASKLHIGSIPDNMALMSIMEVGKGQWNRVGAMFEPATGLVWTSNPDPFDIIPNETVIEVYAKLYNTDDPLYFDPLVKMQELYPTKNIKADALAPLTVDSAGAAEYELSWVRLLNEGRDAQLKVAVRLFKLYTGVTVY